MCEICKKIFLKNFRDILYNLKTKEKFCKKLRIFLKLNEILYKI